MGAQRPESGSEAGVRGVRFESELEGAEELELADAERDAVPDC